MKKLYCTLDTETLNGIVTPKLAYHIAGIIHDNTGKIVATFNYLVAQLFDAIRNDDYHKAHFSDYQEMVQNGSATLVPTVDDAVNAIEALLSFYGVETVMAYNAGFDLVRGACSPLVESREWVDLYCMALECLTIRKKYAQFCRDNNLRSRSGRTVATSAEAVYAFLTADPSYEERHTAFEDSKIEMEIFVACIRAHKKYSKNIVARDAGKLYQIPKFRV